MKRGFAPANAIRRDEIVEEVVENLRPWKNHKSRESVTAAVNQQLDVLVELAPSLAKLSERYRGPAKKLANALSNVENSNCLYPE